MHFRAYLPDISQNSEGVIRSVVVPSKLLGNMSPRPAPGFGAYECSVWTLAIDITLQWQHHIRYIYCADSLDDGGLYTKADSVVYCTVTSRENYIHRLSVTGSVNYRTPCLKQVALSPRRSNLL